MAAGPPPARDESPEALDRRKRWDDFTLAIRTAARGNWNPILRQLAPKLGPALQRPGEGVKCPGHGGNDGFRVYAKHEVRSQEGSCVCNSCGTQNGGFATLMFVNGWTYPEAVKEVGKVLDIIWGNETTGIASRALLEGPADSNYDEEMQRRDIRALKKLNEALTASLPVDWAGDNPVTRYMRHRGLADILKDPPQDIRWLPSVEYWTEVDVRDAQGNPVEDAQGEVRRKPMLVGKYPVFLALIRNPKGDLIGLHRHYIEENGSKPFKSLPQDLIQRIERPGKTIADLLKSKKRMTSPSWLNEPGGSVWLYNGGRSLGIGEGVETMLGVRLLIAARQMGRKLSVRAALDAGGLEKFIVPAETEDLLIFGDSDAITSRIRKTSDCGRGEEAARVLRERNIDRGGARIFLPVKIDTDWLDVYNGLMSREQKIDQRYRHLFGTKLPAPAAQERQQPQQPLQQQAAMPSPSPAPKAAPARTPGHVPAVTPELAGPR